MSLEGSDHPIKNWGKSLTRQSELKSADINVIMAKYVKTGVLPVATREGFFADVSTVGDYREALHRVMQAEDYFYKVPPQIRKRFENDPAKFLDFISDPKNLPEIEEMGLIEGTRPKKKPEVPPPDQGGSVPGASDGSVAAPAGDASGGDQ